VCPVAGAQDVEAPAEIPEAQIPYQVEIEVIIADLSKDFTKDLGFIYRFTESPERADEDFRIGDTFILLPATTDGTVSSPLNHGFVGLDIQGNILGVDFGTFSARLQAAIGRGEGEILARPRIMTLNGMAAALNTGERQPFLSRRLAGTNNNYVFTSEYIDTGVTLNVVPDVILQGDDDPDNDFVRLNMEIKVDFLSRDFVVIDSGQQQPVVSTRDAKTTIIVRDNNTFGIGGLYREDVKISKRKIPFLSDIPLLGWFFRGTNESKSSFELVVFITPRIDRNIEYELKAMGGAGAEGGQ
jgi:type II secretory pathway component GspD/PulD (secretin)